jgi:AcrR family transcriptional regulator
MEISKIEEKKQIKRDKLLASAYTLFIRKGLYDTSINDIVEYAGVAKGTFYLYFKDKWDINEQVIIEKSRLLFDEAIINTNDKRIESFDDRLINIVDYIINTFIDNNDLMKLINKNLSLGLYNKILDSEYINIKEMFTTELKKYNKKIKNPDVVLYMIVELVGSSIYNSIINDIPLPINEYKPYLFEQIRKMIK